MTKRIQDALICELVDAFAAKTPARADNEILGPGRYSGELAPYEHLLSPCAISSLRLSNRCMLAPIRSGRGELAPNEDDRLFYLERAASGIALFTTPAFPASHCRDPQPLLHWRALNERLHSLGSKNLLQIALDGSSPKEIVYLAAAAPFACFDGICLYGRENDDSAEETVRLLRRRFGPAYPILYRASLSPAVSESGISTPKATVIRGVREELDKLAGLARIGVDAFEISLGGPDTPWLLSPSAYLPAACYAEAARAVRAHLRCIGLSRPVFAFGHLSFPDAAEKLLRDGICDMISLDGAGLSDPGWLRKVKEGKVQKIRPVPLPQYDAEPGAKRVAVIGAGCRGMTYALQAADKGCRVDLIEARDTPGGRLAAFPSAAFYQREDLLRYLLTEIEKNSGIALITRTRADLQLLAKGAYDRIVFTCGNGKYASPSIPGWGETPTLSADMLSDSTLRSLCGKKIAILGDDAFSCELAWFLQTEVGAKRAAVVSAHSQILPEGPDADRAWFEHHVPLRGGLILTGCRPRKVKKGVLFLEDIKTGKTKALPCSRIILTERASGPMRLYDEALRNHLADEIIQL